MPNIGKNALHLLHYYDNYKKQLTKLKGECQTIRIDVSLYLYEQKIPILWLVREKEKERKTMKWYINKYTAWNTYYQVCVQQFIANFIS